jgi:hypothetical protein
MSEIVPVMRAPGVNVRLRKRRTFATVPDYDRNAARTNISRVQSLLKRATSLREQQLQYALEDIRL